MPEPPEIVEDSVIFAATSVKLRLTFASSANSNVVSPAALEFSVQAARAELGPP